MPDKVATFVAVSGNAKVGRMSVTYAPIAQTCPSTCRLRREGTCYAMLGPASLPGQRAERAAKGMRARAVARAEAAEVDASFGGGPVPELDGAPRVLRLHVSGDARERESARILGAAAKRWRERGGGPVYTYTHAWRTVPRSEWGESVSVLGSVDAPEDAPAAMAAGYAPAVVVPEHPEGGRAWTDEHGTKWVPCPAQTRDVTCRKCGLCMRGDALARARTGVAFAAHGTRARKLRERTSLQVVR